MTISDLFSPGEIIGFLVAVFGAFVGAVGWIFRIDTKVRDLEARDKELHEQSCRIEGKVDRVLDVLMKHVAVKD